LTRASIKRGIFLKWMDCRVKPGNDTSEQELAASCRPALEVAGQAAGMTEERVGLKT